MEGRKDVVALSLGKGSSYVSHYGFIAVECFVCRRAQKHNDLGLNKGKLLCQELLAGSDFRRLGAPVLGRAALNDIADMVILSFKP